MPSGQIGEGDQVGQAPPLATSGANGPVLLSNYRLGYDKVALPKPKFTFRIC